MHSIISQYQSAFLKTQTGERIFRCLYMIKDVQRDKSVDYRSIAHSDITIIEDIVEYG